MIRELMHFVRQFPAAKQMSGELNRAELLEFVENQVDAAGKGRWRAEVVADLTGDVLEIGAGTGRMFPYLKRGVCLMATDPDEELLALAAEKVKQSAAQIMLKPARGETLPFPDGSFDAVVCCSVLCSVQSVEQSLGQIRRVLGPGGQLRLIEHVKSERLASGLLMDAFNPVWLRLNGAGCNMNRNVEAPLKSAGFVLERVERFQLFPDKFPMAFPYRAIWAVSPGNVSEAARKSARAEGR